MTADAMGAVTTPVIGPATEQAIARDLAKRGLWVAPLFLAIGALWGGWHGFASAGVGIALVCINFLAAAALMTVAARISLALLMASVLGGYIVRLAAITGVIIALRHQSWFHRGAFGLTVLVTHLGLLIWETRYISASLAYPGLKPKISPSRTNS